MTQTLDTVRMVPQRQRIITPPEPMAVSKLDRLRNDLMAAFGQKDFHVAYRHMLEIVQEVHGDNRMPSPEREAETNRALSTLFSVFVSPEIEVPEVLAQQFIHFISTIGNAADSCGLGTDASIAGIGEQKQRAFKLAILNSARSENVVDIRSLFQANADLASSWFCQNFKIAFSGNLSERVRENLLTIAKLLPEGSLKYCKDLQEPYFTISYFGDDDAEKKVKAEINRVARSYWKDTPKPAPIRKRVAVITENWSLGHSVYRTIKAYIDSLRPDYELVLIHSIKDSKEFQTDGFAEVIKLPYDGITLDASPLENQGFCAVLYPDIGMTSPSILLSNRRIAPVQVMFTGHPISTFGAEIDHFISGEWTENSTHARNYSENHVRLPGFGCVHEKPTYQVKGRKKSTDKIVINASWYGQKITPMALNALNDAVVASGRDVLVRMFAGGGATNYGAFPAVIRDVGKMLPNCETEIVPHLAYDQYMAVLNAGDLAVDVFPFAGSNTVSDNLWLRKPVVCLEGDRWYNRIGPAMLRRIGIDSPQSVEQYVSRVAHLIADDASRAELTAHIEAADLDSAIYCRDGANEFREWFDAKTSQSANPA